MVQEDLHLDTIITLLPMLSPEALFSLYCSHHFHLPVTTRCLDCHRIWRQQCLCRSCLYSPAANFVQRGNTTFSKIMNDEWRMTFSCNLVLYNEFTAILTTGLPIGIGSSLYFLNPDMTTPAQTERWWFICHVFVNFQVKHNILLTGYAVDAGRFDWGIPMIWLGADQSFPLIRCRSWCSLVAKTR